MEQIISKEEVNKYMNFKGEVREASFRAYGKYILKEEGKEGLKKVEDIMAEAGFPIKYRGIKIMKFYPLGYQALTTEIIKRLFNWDDKKLEEMGRFSAKLPFVVRLFIMGYFFSIKTVIKETPRLWRENFTIGTLRITELDEERKYAILRLENFVFHPLYCKVLQGFFSGISELVIKNPITCEETKCIYRGDEYHEFLIRW